MSSQKNGINVQTAVVIAVIVTAVIVGAGAYFILPGDTGPTEFEIELEADKAASLVDLKEIDQLILRKLSHALIPEGLNKLERGIRYLENNI